MHGSNFINISQNIFISAVVFLELWKRKQAVIAWEWDLTKFEEDEPLRPQYEAKVKTTRYDYYLQSYLNLAYHKMEEMKLEAGKISNIELQKSLSRIFYYLCVVS